MSTEMDLIKIIYTSYDPGELYALRVIVAQMPPEGGMPPDDNDIWLAVAGTVPAQRITAEGYARLAALGAEEAEADATCDMCGPAVRAAAHMHGLDLCWHCTRKLAP